MNLYKIIVPACFLVAINLFGTWENNTAFGAADKKPSAKKSAPQKKSVANSKKAVKAAPNNSAKAIDNSTKTTTTTNNSDTVTPINAISSPCASTDPMLPSGDAFTSLIIDATGFKLDRSMSPKILRSDGVQVWGSLAKLTDEQYDIIQERGMVSYAKTVEEACANSRAGLRPLIVRAIGTTGGKLCSDVVVADTDAERILVENSKSKFLEVFNIIFVQNEVSPKSDEPKSKESAANDQNSNSIDSNSIDGEKEENAK